MAVYLTDENGRKTKVAGSGGGGLQYPIDSIYISTSSTSPASLFGGTWEQLKDRFLLGAGDIYNAGTTGGSADAVVVSHSHTVQDGDSTYESHLHNTANGANVLAMCGTHNATKSTATTNTVGVSGVGKNMPPYIAVYMWKRTA